MGIRQCNTQAKCIRESNQINKCPQHISKEISKWIRTHQWSEFCCHFFRADKTITQQNIQTNKTNKIGRWTTTIYLYINALFVWSECQTNSLICIEIKHEIPNSNFLTIGDIGVFNAIPNFNSILNRFQCGTHCATECWILFVCCTQFPTNIKYVIEFYHPRVILEIVRMCCVIAISINVADKGGKIMMTIRFE